MRFDEVDHAHVSRSFSGLGNFAFDPRIGSGPTPTPWAPESSASL